MGGWISRWIDRSVKSIASHTDGQFVGVMNTFRMSSNYVCVSDLSDDSWISLVVQSVSIKQSLSVCNKVIDWFMDGCMN